MVEQPQTLPRGGQTEPYQYTPISTERGPDPEPPGDSRSPRDERGPTVHVDQEGTGERKGRSKEPERAKPAGAGREGGWGGGGREREQERRRRKEENGENDIDAHEPRPRTPRKGDPAPP